MSKEEKEEAVELPSSLTMITRMLEDAEIEHEYYNDGKEIWIELENGVRFSFDDEEILTIIGVRIV